MAESLLHHGRLEDPAGRLSASREPGYPLLLATLYRVTGPSYRAGQMLNCLLGVLTLILIFQLADAIFGPETAWLATVIAAFYPQFLYYASTLERETFQTFLLAGTVWQLVRAGREPSARAYVAAGVLAALCALTNSALLPAAAALAFGIWSTRRDSHAGAMRRVCVYLAVFIGLYSLWPLRNYHVFHRPILGINGGGAHIYIGILVPNEAAGTAAEAALLEKDPVSQSAAHLDETARDRIFYQATFRYIQQHPLSYMKICIKSLVKLWRLYPYARAYAYNYRLIKWVALLSDGWIIPLGFIGLLLTRRRALEIDFFYIVLSCVSLTYMLFWAIVRYRLPMMPFVIILCARTLHVAYLRMASMRRAQTPQA